MGVDDSLPEGHGWISQLSQLPSGFCSSSFTGISLRPGPVTHFVFQQSTSSILMTRCDLLACGTYTPGQRWLLRLFVPRDLGPLSPHRSASQPSAAANLSS